MSQQPEDLSNPYASDATEVVDPGYATEQPERTGLGRVVVRVLLAAVLGAVVAGLGTATHRTFLEDVVGSHDVPLGLVVALALTASTAVLCRAWSGLATLAAAGLGWLVAVQVLSMPGGGGDVLVTDPNAPIPWAWAGLAWTYAGIVLFGIVAFLPRRWFDRR